MKRFIPFIIALAILLPICQTPAFAQKDVIKPVDLPMSFSGTYGELRHNHFHGGLDWRVGGKVGDPIHVIKDGWIHHVTVSPSGYGNGMYVQHYDGTMTVYGHMLAFRPEIAARVKDEQYARESFSVTLYFEENEYPVKQGDVLGKVGNTGASAGPHLHMEVRDSDNVPLDYLRMGYYEPTDNMSPVISRVAFYALDSLPVPDAVRILNVTNPAQYSGVVCLPEKSYVAIDAYDRQDGTSGKLAVSRYTVLLDDEPIFDYEVGDVGFDEGPYIKSLIQYGESRIRGRDMVKSYVEPGNILDDRIEAADGGLVVLRDDEPHALKIVTEDIFGNRSSVRFAVRRDDSIQVPVPRDSSDKTHPWLWYVPNTCADGDMTYTLPAGSLYSSINFTYSKVGCIDTLQGIYSDIWSIGDLDVPLSSPGLLQFHDFIPEELLPKAYVASGSGLSYAGPLDGARVGFGTYCVAVDLEGPSISVDKNGSIRVRDERSGTASVRVEIDGKWHLSMFKRGRVTILDTASIPKGTHNVAIVATDYCGNSTVKEIRKSF